MKTGAILQDVTMHRDVTMRVKGWKGRCSDHSCSESDHPAPVLSVYLSIPASKRFSLLQCSGLNCQITAMVFNSLMSGLSGIYFKLLPFRNLLESNCFFLYLIYDKN